MSDSEELDLSALSMKDIRSVASSRLVIPRGFQRRNDVVKHIQRYVSDNLREDLERANADKFDERSNTNLSAKTKLDRNIKHYLSLPTEECVQYCYRRFYEATGNSALNFIICGVCARTVNAKDDEVRIVPLDEIPNSHRLQLFTSSSIYWRIVLYITRKSGTL